MYIFGESKSTPSVTSARVQRWALIYSAYRTDNLRNIFLRNTFATFGLPEILVIDNGTNFSSTELEEFLKSVGIWHSRTAPYHPAFNSLAEHAALSFKLGIKELTMGLLEAQVAKSLLTYTEPPPDNNTTTLRFAAR